MKKTLFVIIYTFAITHSAFAGNFKCLAQAEYAAKQILGTEYTDSMDYGGRFISEAAGEITYEVDFFTQEPIDDFGSEEFLEAKFRVVTRAKDCTILSAVSIPTFTNAVATNISAVNQNSIPIETLESKVSLSFTQCAEIGKSTNQFVYDKSCIENVYNNHPMTSTRFNVWQQIIQKPVEDRFVNVTQDMIEYMTMDNLLWGFPYENIQAVSDPDLISDANIALKNLPAVLQKYIQEHFYGFMLVSGVGWTGFASSVLVDPSNALKAGAVIIINADNIKNRNLNEWLEFRENTVFDFLGTTNSKYKLKMKYVDQGQKSSVADNLRHFLIHETAHLVVNAVPSIHPAFKYRNKPVPISEFESVATFGVPLEYSYPFLNVSWALELVPEIAPLEDTYVLTRELNSELAPILASKPVKFYTTDVSSKFNLAEAKRIYKNLNDSCFVSLYSTVDYTEDFAESTTHYFMSYLEKMKYSVELIQTEPKGNEVVLASFEDNTWANPACKAKLEFLDSLYK